MHFRHILILTLLLALVAPSALAAPASKKRVKVKRPSGGSDEVDADSGTPNMLMDYEPASVTENGVTSTGIWVPNPSSGGCLMWSTDRVTPLSNFKPTCDAPRLKTWVIGVLAAIAGLLILCCCCCVCIVRRAGGGLMAVIKGVKSGQGLKAFNKGNKDKDEAAAPMAGTYPLPQPPMQQQQSMPSPAAYPPQQSMLSPAAYPPQQSMLSPAAYPPQQSMPMPSSPAPYPPQSVPMPYSQAAPAAYPPVGPEYPPPQQQQQQQQQMPAYPPQSY